MGDHRNNYRGRDAFPTNRGRDYRAPYPPPMGEYNNQVAPVFTLDSLTKHPEEILATETQLRLPAPRPMLNLLRTGNIDRYCDYHQEKGHYINDYIRLRKQLEMALESRKLNHLVKDKWKGWEVTEAWMNTLITFPSISSEDISDEPLIVEAEVEGYLVKRVYVDEGSSVEVVFDHCFKNLDSRIKAKLKETQTDIVGFTGEISKPLGKIELARPGLKTLRAIPSTIHSMMKFPTPKGVAMLVTRKTIIAECKRLEKKQMIEEESSKRGKEVSVTEEVLVNLLFLDQLVTIGRGLSEAGIVRPVRYPTYISNPVLVKKGDGTWRMCIDFKNLNSAYPKDYYPLPNIDCKVESVMGFRCKCSLDAYKGYHQIQMAEEDKEKTTFYTDQGTYYYTKIPFGLKNAGATYQRLVDLTFQSQIGRNLKAYVDDMVIKSKDEKMLLADIAKTLDNLKKNQYETES
ncbi:reverse transcriptase domain-containing protein [Tanacetum coccineum]